MPSSLRIEIFENQNLAYSTTIDEPLELGRQTETERGPFIGAEPGASGVRRLVIARRYERDVSRQHVLLEPLGNGLLLLRNLSGSQPVMLNETTPLPAGGSTQVNLPARLLVGSKTVRVESAAPAAQALGGLEHRTLLPGQMFVSDHPSEGTILAGPQVDSEAVVRWLQSTLAVLQSAATSEDFYRLAARTVVEVGALDAGSVLMRRGEEWETVATHTAEGVMAGAARRPSRRILQSVCEERRTMWEQPEVSTESTHSLTDVGAVIASPILDSTGAVIGVLYGDRQASRGIAPGVGVKKIEAMVVEMLACSVAAGLNRLNQEQRALALRVQFGQFFSPGLSEQIEKHPELLEGRQADVSVLVADIRGFSRISARSGPEKTLAWIRDMLTPVDSDSPRWRIVDYVGMKDGHVGRAQNQPDHALRACRALEMMAELPRLNERWQAFLGEPVEIGIGVNTGTALVGNVGSDRKFKYGPIGSTVNLASRVQGMTKYLRSNLIVTAATRARLEGDFRTRRLCTVRVVNIPEPVELYELGPREGASFVDVQADYERALQEFERGRFEQAAQILGQVFALRPKDGPALLLMSRAITCLVEQPVHFDPVWIPPGK